MHKFNTLQDVIDLATLAHKHDRDKAGEPYINHPLRVMRAVQDQGAKPYVQMAAVLHDVPEDTRFSHDILLALGVPEAAVTLTRLLDRHYSVTTFGFGSEADNTADHYYFEIRKNPEARMIKLADIADNMLEWRLSYLPQAKQDQLKVKYDNAKRLLGVN